LALTASPATLSGRDVPGGPAERLWARNFYTLRGVRGGGRRVLVLRCGPLLARHRENDRSQAGDLLAGLLELHQPSLPLGERQLQKQAHANNCPSNRFAVDQIDLSAAFLTEKLQILGAFRKIAKSDYHLRHVCLSVCPHGTAWLPRDGFS